MSTPSFKNPLPGMNPYLEESWDDVHTMLLGYIRDALANELPLDLNARAEEREVLLEDDEQIHYVADVAVTEREEAWRSGAASSWQPATEGASTQVLSEPVIIYSEPETERWLEIREGKSGKLVTVIELLSPSNKLRHATKYVEKRRGHIDAGVNLVEIDLLRAGKHVLAVPLEMIRAKLRKQPAYLVCVTRGIEPSRHEVYFCPLRQPLPAVRIPLREHDKDVALELQPLIDRCYELGRYWQTNFSRALEAPLSADDASWLKEKLTAAGLRVEA